MKHRVNGLGIVITDLILMGCAYGSTSDLRRVLARVGQRFFAEFRAWSIRLTANEPHDRHSRSVVRRSQRAGRDHAPGV